MVCSFCNTYQDITNLSLYLVVSVLHLNIVSGCRDKDGSINKNLADIQTL